MKRKVIQLAGNTLVVSLPSAWARKYDVKKGDELDVIEDKSVLSLESGKDLAAPQKTTIDVSGVSADVIKSMLSVLHKIGYDELEFLYDSPAALDSLKARVSELIGFEIVEASDRRCLIKHVTKDAHEDLDHLIRRTFFVLLTMIKESHEILKKKEFGKLAKFAEAESSINRLTSYCHRLLNKSPDGPKSTFTYLVLWILEHIADDYRDLFAVANIRQLPLDPSVLEMYQQVGEQVERYYHFYYGDLDAVAELREKNGELRETISLMQSKVGVPDAHYLLHLDSIVRHVYDCLGSTTGKKFLEVHERSS